MRSSNAADGRPCAGFVPRPVTTLWSDEDVGATLQCAGVVPFLTCYERALMFLSSEFDSHCIRPKVAYVDDAIASGQGFHGIPFFVEVSSPRQG